MTSANGWLEDLLQLIPSVDAVVIFFVVLFIAKIVLQKRRAVGRGRHLESQLVMVTLTFLGLIAIIISLPLRDATKGQLLTLIGLLVTAAIALSSTTFVGNAMAGIMLRAVRNFRTGDFVRVGEHFGRISERGLFHTEIQTEDRDLTTLPNLYLVSTPVTVMRTSGTILSATVSLGYDAPRSKVERRLLEAGEAAQLKDPYVQVLQLGDFSVTYRLAGLLGEVKQVLSARSRLRGLMLDHLHRGGVEIVSPSFMNTRAFPEQRSFIPQEPVAPRHETLDEQDTTAEELAFDKAEEAASAELLEKSRETLAAEINSLKERIKETHAEQRAPLEAEMERLEARMARLSKMLDERKED